MPSPDAVSSRPNTVATLSGYTLAVTAKLAVALAVHPMARKMRRTKQ